MPSAPSIATKMIAAGRRAGDGRHLLEARQVGTVERKRERHTGRILHHEVHSQGLVDRDVPGVQGLQDGRRLGDIVAAGDQAHDQDGHKRSKKVSHAPEASRSGDG